MGALISMCSSSSKGSSNARIKDSSIWYPQPDQHISIQTFRELNQVPMSNPILIKTETPSNGVSFRSTEDLLEGVNKQPMMLTPKQLTQEVSRRLLM
uniref:C4 protein n=2 Tax=Begomovirus TaxID=10814 RepID=B1PR46_9GEMI|nr:C4 protein [Tomato leaf curl virus]ACA52119.2 C4 protein [Tomato leaf curl virus]ANJ77872.1 C4 [Tomato leaf curl Cebu virus]